MWSSIIPKHVKFCLITPNCQFLDSVFKNLCKCLLVKAITFPIFLTRSVYVAICSLKKILAVVCGQLVSILLHHDTFPYGPQFRWRSENGMTCSG